MPHGDVRCVGNIPPLILYGSHDRSFVDSDRNVRHGLSERFVKEKPGSIQVHVKATPVVR